MPPEQLESRLLRHHFTMVVRDALSSTTEHTVPHPITESKDRQKQNKNTNNNNRASHILVEFTLTKEPPEMKQPVREERRGEDNS